NAEVTVNANLTPAVELTKALDPAGQSFDAVGDVITYQLALANTGNAPLYNPQVTDAGATSGPTYQSGDVANTGVLDAGETWTYTATYQITQADLNSGSYTNEAAGSAQAELIGDVPSEHTVNVNAEVTVNADLTPAI